MAYFWMIVCVITCTIQTPFKKIYQGKTDKGTYLFTAMIQLAAALFFAGACIFGGFSYEWGALLYSCLFALSATVFCITSVVVLRYGSLALTVLFVSYSSMIPTLYGFLRFKNSVYVPQLIGIALLLVSLYLTNMGKKEGAEEKKESWNFKKWLPLVIVMAISNGMCAVIQTEQQYRFDGAYKNEFMMIALLLSFAVLFALGILCERGDAKTVWKLGALPAVLTGVSNGATNLLVMVVTATIAASVFFPVISGGGMVLAYVISVTVFRERFAAAQKIGILLGIASLVFLNLPFGAL